jgi:hypothetical protein
VSDSHSLSLPEIERRYTEGGQPSLGDAFRLLNQRWLTGSHDRETVLRLLFLAWYSCSEPPFLTGLTDVGDSASLFRELFAFLGGENSDDEEFLFVAGYMVSLFACCVGPEAEWVLKGERCLTRWRQLARAPIDPARFEGRGAYGQYFAHIARTGWSGV